MTVRAASLPGDALLQAYASDGASYTDCFAAPLERTVDLPVYLDAFYRSWAFRGEALVLSLALRARVDLAGAARLGRGETDRFAAWTVEARGAGQVLLRDITGRTRSWLAVASEADGGTKLYFGSAVVRPSGGGGGPLRRRCTGGIRGCFSARRRGVCGADEAATGTGFGRCDPMTRRRRMRAHRCFTTCSGRFWTDSDESGGVPRQPA